MIVSTGSSPRSFGDLGERLAGQRLERLGLELDEQHAVGRAGGEVEVLPVVASACVIACAIFLRVAGSCSRLKAAS